ncbi:TonB-dependent receptor [Pseudohalioglobus sediminis]|uniref:TonB-dependent receptor n=1 Tax=Pseudohalioglobus sediminis TaxID=2606449 RepID=A0A5B0X1S5_9GAMM|nr:TonB-dependent receptor [Pseudohalioglobus sediminis]KAA1193290.1 TonB-dependent receptor [Pseudohalioglobus sediminis]
MHKPFKQTFLSLAVIAAVGATDYAAAQLEEVVVTARKRSESLQDVPMAVSAFNTAQLQDAQVDRIEDLERMTPNITLTETGGLQAGSVVVFMRGIGNDPQFAQGVGIYVDDVYMNRATGSLLEVYDVERIEMLKGPQGNLYGRNTIGGAIKYVSREPTDELTGDIEFKTGEFDLMQVKGNISGPIIGDTLLGNFGALYRERDGIQENTLDGEEYWDQDVSAYRGALVWNATDNLRFKLAGDYNKDESAPRVPNRSGVAADIMAQLDFFTNGANFFLAPGTGLLQTPNDVSLPSDPDEISTEQGALLNQYEIESTTLSLTIDWDIGDRWALKSITAQRDTDHVQPFDFDGSEQRFIHTINDREFEDFSQEFQLNYTGDSLAAVMGVYYLDGSAAISGSTTQYPRLLGSTLQVKDTFVDDRDIESMSVYANVDWDFAESWQLSLGGRYTKDEKEERQEATVNQQIYAVALANAPFGIVPLAIAPGQGDAAAASPNFAGWATPFTDAINISFPEPTYAKDDWTEFSPSARLTWFTTDDVMVYAGFSSGFKSGGFQNQSGKSTAYDPETVDSYTLGMKTTWLDGSLRANGEIFFNDYQDKQLATIGLRDGNLEEFVDNVGELETSGAEIELTWLPAISGLTLGLNVGYLDVDVKKFDSAEGDLADTTAIGFSPEWTVQGRVSYDFDLSDWGSMMVGTDVSYRTESYTNSPIDLTSPAADAQIQEEHAIWNAIAAFRSANGHWRVALEGKNLEDKRVITNTFDLTLFQTAGYNMPRTWAVSVGYEF